MRAGDAGSAAIAGRGGSGSVAAELCLSLQVPSRARKAALPGGAGRTRRLAVRALLAAQGGRREGRWPCQRVPGQVTLFLTPI